ncbi:hypothetical protein BT63DRAFT_453667 [Microthyrium microscopicum]|uniref:Xylanolytic transcriptional activator regulatory domain-containing protein n=1 Tax=Microthyrium microscopicum TaxID=703497 RepID=A0A6A6UII1_9PEZI|nr:hypothetical protein BT63DRAFT_453667 [Microthyrium microscopicum]
MAPAKVCFNCAQDGLQKCCPTATGCSRNRRVKKKNVRIARAFAQTSEEDSDHDKLTTPIDMSIERIFPADSSREVDQVTAFFLDRDVFQEKGYSKTPISVAVPDHCQTWLTRGFNRQVERKNDVFWAGYAQSWQTAFPIISKARFDERFADSSRHTPDFIALMLAMQLGTDRKDTHEGVYGLYQNVKQWCQSLEAHGMISLLLLQTYMLIALYEVSHAIHPAAYLTIGHLVRLAELLQLQQCNNPHRLNGASRHWLSVEEERRAWWGIYILDRYTSICGFRTVKPVLDEPATDMSLPMDDENFHLGDKSESHSIFRAHDRPVSPFARTCQAAILLSKVIKNTKKDKPYISETAYLRMDISQLRTFCAHESLILPRDPKQFSALLPAIAILFSAELALNYSQATKHTGNDVSVCCPSPLRLETRNFAEALQRHYNNPHTRTAFGPFIPNALYQMAKCQAFDVLTLGEVYHDNNAEVLRYTLRLSGENWREGDMYLKMLQNGNQDA